MIVFFPAGIVGAYYWQVFRHDPLWSQSRLASVGAPDFGLLLFAFGPLAVGAWFGARKLLAWRAGGDSIPFAWAGFPIIWALVNACTLLLPVWQQGRQTLGLSIPLALLTFLALAGPSSSVARDRAWLPALPAALMAFSSSLLLALYTAITAGAVNADYYAPVEVAHAVDWLGAHAGPGDVVLSGAGFGNLVPVRCSCRVVLGQNFETFHLELRQQEVKSFYTAPSTAAARVVLLGLVRTEHVSFYVLSPYERAERKANLAHLAGFKAVFRENTTTIYALQKPHG